MVGLRFFRRQTRLRQRPLAHVGCIPHHISSPPIRRRDIQPYFSQSPSGIDGYVLLIVNFQTARMSGADEVYIWGTVQRFAPLKSALDLAQLLSCTALRPEAGNLTIVDAESRESVNFPVLCRQAHSLRIDERLAVDQPQYGIALVVVVRVPASLLGLKVLLALILSGRYVIVPLPYDLTEASDVERVLQDSGACVYISTRESLLELDYVLVRLGIKGASVGGEGQLLPQNVDLTAKLITEEPIAKMNEPETERRDLDSSIMFFYDSGLKRLYDVSQRSVYAISASCVRTEDEFWNERVLTDLGGSTLLAEVFPRLFNSPTTTERLETMKMTIVLDPLYSSRRRFNKSKSLQSSLKNAGSVSMVPSDIAQIFAIASKSSLGLVKVGVRQEPKEKQVTTKSGATGRLCLHGPCIFSRQVGPRQFHDEPCLFFDGDFRLWFEVPDQVTLEEPNHFSVLSEKPSSPSAQTPSGPTVAARPRRTAVPKPPPRPARPHEPESKL